MDDFLLRLQLDPQIPFGHLLFTAAWLLTTLLIAFFVLRSIRRKGITAKPTIIGIMALLLATPVLYANLTIPDAVDFEPAFSVHNLIGNWKSDDHQLQLNEDGTAQITLEPALARRSGFSNGKGNWKKTPAGNIVLKGQRPGDGQLMLRAIRHRRELRLIIEDTGASQLWDGDLGFKKQ